MLQFIGLSFVVEPAGVRAVSVVVDRKGLVMGGSTAPVAGVKREENGVLEVRAGEWVRAGALALKDAFFQVPAKVRRVWGFALAGPPGWVALDPALEPLAGLRLTASPREDLTAWLGAHPRLRSHLYAVLPPKDYFRFAVSGALATDVTQAETFGWLLPGSTRWSHPDLDAAGLPHSWLPPIFDSTVATGRISEDGMRRTGLPGGLWVVAGTLAGREALVSAGDLRAGAVLASAPEAETLELNTLAASLEGPLPEGFEGLRSPLAGYRVFRRRVRLAPQTGEAGAQAVEAARDFLSDLGRTPVAGLATPERLVVDYRPEYRMGPPPPWADVLAAGAGLPVSKSPYAGAEDPGVAFLAGLAQGAYRGPDDLYRKLREAHGGRAPAGKDAEEKEEPSS